MTVFNVYYRNKLGPNSFESILASTEEEAIQKFKTQYPDSIIEVVLKPKLGDRR